MAGTSRRASSPNYRRSPDLSEVFHRITLVSHRNGRARIGQAECHARTVFKIDFELRLGLMNGFYFTAWRYRWRSRCRLALGGVIWGSAVAETGTTYKLLGAAGL